MSTPTMEQRVARVFGLHGDGWMRHANPASVWTRFSVLWILALAIWSRDWIGWWSLGAVGLALVWMMVNPLFFPPPRSTRNWASRGVLGERVWAARNDVEVPAQFRSPVPNVSNALGAIGLIVLAYGLVRFDVVAAVSGVLITNISKAWYIDRMVLLFEDMRQRNSEYASWDF
ncbi:DUF6653 family protein [Actinoplanes sp. URMC 104]|uniref:DUF6653 family protein n=1 Tax=Actinoplanes sp. URMC 104 TaxID=3423409 RepID=UPI003F1D5C8E